MVDFQSFTHVTQELEHALGSVDAHQHDLVAEQDLQSDKHQDLTGAADHFVPHPKEQHVGFIARIVLKPPTLRTVGQKRLNKSRVYLKDQAY